jgi:hypothetical protein
MQLLKTIGRFGAFTHREDVLVEDIDIFKDYLVVFTKKQK